MEPRELDYDLPPELIAQHPADRRDESRLLVLDRRTGAVQHRVFRELRELLPADTLSVVNDTRVVPARIPIESPKGEVLLLERVEGDVWEGLPPPPPARPGRGGGGGGSGAVGLLEPLGGARWRLRLDGDPGGRAPLPPYITEPLADPA